MTSTPATREEFFEALRENRDRPKGRATAALAEELVDAAEAFGDPEVTVSALVELMRAYHGSGESVKYPVAFARLLQLWDEDPKAFDEYEAHQLFWYFKWVASALMSTPDVPLTSIRGWIAEMRRRYQDAGHDLQPVYAQEYFLAAQSGENEQLAHELWATRGRTRFSDCAACEARERADFHFRRGEDERGLAELKPTFDGSSSCDEEPHSSQALALLPLLRLGRFDEARAAHLTGYRKVRGRESELTAIGRHLQFCALTGNEARGLELLAHSRGCFAFTASPYSRLDFLTGAESLLARLVETGRGDLPCAGPAGREWTAASLRTEVAAQAGDLAGRFDARNGSNAVSARRQEALALRPLVAHLNLGVQTAALARPADTAPGGGPAPVPAPTEAPAVPDVPDVPEDFAELLAEACRLDRAGGPRTKALWDAVIERADGPDGDRMDDVARAHLASELAQRAVQRHDWDACAAHLDRAVELYTGSGAHAWRIAAEARRAWCAAVREDQAGASAAEAAWPVLGELLARIEALLAAGFDDEERRREALSRKLVVRQSRVFTARHAMLHARDQEQHTRWSTAFSAEAQTLVAEGTAAGVRAQPSVAHEVLAEHLAMHGAAVEGEAHARRALAIFEEQGWSWRLPRGRMLLALTLGSQGRHDAAVDELQRALAEAPPEVPQSELTPLHRMLGSMAVHARQYPTAVRALSEAAARLDREGQPEEARETRLNLGRALCAQGAVGDGVAVLESLLDPFAAAAATGALPQHTDADATGEPSPTEQLTAQIRVDLANALLSLGEHREAAGQFLQLADAVSRWPEKGPLASAAAGAAGALAQAGNWDGARAALERALEANREAPMVPDLTDALRTLAIAAAEARGADAAQEALGYLDRADRLREEFADAARQQFRSVDVDEAQCLYTRGRVHAVTGRFEEALAAFEQAVSTYDRGGWAATPQRFEAVRLAALVEGRSLERPDAARARLDRAAAEADAAGLSEAAATLRRLRAGLG